METNPDFKFIAQAPSNVLGVVEHKGMIIVACEAGVYELKKKCINLHASGVLRAGQIYIAEYEYYFEPIKFLQDKGESVE
jgi:hypothetical protein